MTILFGHPAGNPNSYHAALAHFEAGCLEAVCIPWMPSESTLRILSLLGPVRKATERLRRRSFPALASAPKIQGRLGEWGRLLARARGKADEKLSYEANDWLMETMTRGSRRERVTAVHAYEDCSLLQFSEAKRLGKACIYDMPIGYYPAWERTQEELVRRYRDWLPSEGLRSSQYVRPEQKREEMRLADMVLVPSMFVAKTIREFYPDKAITLAPYGVDTGFWTPQDGERASGPLRFLYAGQLSLRKGAPLLLDAWKEAALDDATLELVGSWQLAAAKRNQLPDRVSYLPPVSREGLREKFRNADLLVFPSYFEGLALVLLEALACGLPIIATESSGAADIVHENCGKIVPTGNCDELVAVLRWANSNRELLREMRSPAREMAVQSSWERYRRCVTTAVSAFV